MRYYHRPKPAVPPARGPEFYRRVDPDLRQLCRLLHARGLLTTPSCQGHDHDRAYFEKRWGDLCDEAMMIRGDGLLLREAETNREYCFRDPDYRLPWPDFSRFLKESQHHQSTGYLGVIVPSNDPGLDARFRKWSRRLGRLAPERDERIGRGIGGHLYYFLITSQSSSERSRRWRNIAGALEDL